MHILNK